MKRNLLNLMAGSMVLLCSSVIAQPTLTATGMNPVIGESYTYFTANYVSPGSSGASQTWNLSSMSGSSGGLTSMVNPASTTNGGSFPTSNVAGDNPTANSTNYYKTSSTAWQNSGIVAGGTVITYSDFEDLLRFPFNYNDTYNDPWAAQFTSGYQFWRTGSTTVTADGYGTLITPTGTYTNVMRVHLVQIYQDSAFIGTPYIITYNNDEYLWYKEGSHLALAAVYNLTTSSGGPYTGGFYVTGTVGIDKIPDYIASSNLFPNPAADQVTINFELTENKKVDVVLFNSLGQKMEVDQSTDGLQGLNSIQLDVRNLPEGIYFAQILVDGNVADTKRFIVNK